MDLEQDIEYAIRERGLREMLAREEQQIRSRERAKKVRTWALSGGGVFAIAAVLLTVFTLVPIARQMQQFSTQYVANLQTGAYRGADEMTASLSTAMTLMQQDQWREAERIIDALYAQTADSEEEEVVEIHQSAEWLKALCLMQRGKVFAARRLLRSIAQSDSYYNTKAQEVLETL